MIQVRPVSPDLGDSPVQDGDDDDVEEPAGHGHLNQDRVQLQLCTAALPGDEPEDGGGNLREKYLPPLTDYLRSLPDRGGRRML